MKLTTTDVEAKHVLRNGVRIGVLIRNTEDSGPDWEVVKATNDGRSQVETVVRLLNSDQADLVEDETPRPEPKPARSRATKAKSE